MQTERLEIAFNIVRPKGQRNCNTVSSISFKGWTIEQLLNSIKNSRFEPEGWEPTVSCRYEPYYDALKEIEDSFRK